MTPPARGWRPWAGWLVAASVVAAVVAVARHLGTSWRQIVWGAFGLFVCALLTQFCEWLFTCGPLRLERRPPSDGGGRGTDRTE